MKVVIKVVPNSCTCITTLVYMSPNASLNHVKNV